VYRQLFPTGESRDRILNLLRELLDQGPFLRGVERTLRRELSDRPALILFGQFDPVRLAGFPRRYRGIFPRHSSRVVPWEGHFPHEGSPAFMIHEITSWWHRDVAEGSA